MNSGTWIVAPVSSVAGLVPPVERSPCRPGSVCAMTSSTAAGMSTYSGVPSFRDRHRLLFKQVVRRVADHGRRDARLVVVRQVHEHEVIALAVQVLHLALVDVGDIHLDASVEGLVD